MARASSRLRGWFVAAALTTAVGLAVPAALGPTIAQARAGRALVACVSQRGLSSFVVFRRAPRTCVLHYAHALFDSAHEFPVVSIRWSGWGRSVVHGRGTFRGNMNFRAPARVVLSRPRRCGKGIRNYTRARITLQGASTSGPLAACRR